MQPGSAASRAHCTLELPLSTTHLDVPCLPRPFPTGLLLVLASHHTAQQAPSPAPFPGISPCPPSSHQTRSPACLGPHGGQPYSPAHQWKRRFLLWHSRVLPKDPIPPHRFPGALCPAQVTAECLWCHWPEGQSRVAAMGCQQLSNSWSLVAQAVLQLIEAIPPAFGAHICLLGFWESRCWKRHQSQPVQMGPSWQPGSGLLDVVLCFVNPCWQIPTTYLLSHAQILIPDIFEDRHEIVLFTVPGDLPQLQLFQGTVSDWSPPLQVLSRTWLLASSTALYRYK